MQQIADAAGLAVRRLVRRGFQVVQAEAELLMLGADAELFPGLTALGDMLGELAKRRNRGRVAVYWIGHAVLGLSGGRFRLDATYSAHPMREQQGQPGGGGGLGPKHERASEIGVTKSRPAQPLALRRSEAAFRSDQQCRRPGAWTLAWRRRTRIAPAPRTAAGRRASRPERRRARMGGSIDRDGQAFALFGGFDGDGAEPVVIDPGGVGAFGDDRQQAGRAQFDGLADDEVGGVALQQREHQPGTGFRLLGPELRFDASATRGRGAAKRRRGRAIRRPCR